MSVDFCTLQFKPLVIVKQLKKTSDMRQGHAGHGQWTIIQENHETLEKTTKPDDSRAITITHDNHPLQ